MPKCSKNITVVNENIEVKPLDCISCIYRLIIKETGTNEIMHLIEEFPLS